MSIHECKYECIITPKTSARTMQLLLEEFGKYADGRQAFFINIYNQVKLLVAAESALMKCTRLLLELHTTSASLQMHLGHISCAGG